LLGAPTRTFDYRVQTGTAEFYDLKNTPASKFMTPSSYCAWSSPPHEQTFDSGGLPRTVPVNLPLAMVQMGDSVSAGEGIGYGYYRSFCGIGDSLRWCPRPGKDPPNGRGGTWLGPWQQCHDSSKAYSQDVARDLNLDPNFTPNGARHGNALNLLNVACTGASYQTSSGSGGFTRAEYGDGIVSRPAEFGNWDTKTQLNHSYFEASPNLVEMATGPNDVRFADAAKWCIAWDVKGNLVSATGLALESVALYVSVGNPIAAGILQGLAIAAFITADKFHQHCTSPDGYNSEVESDWSAVSGVGTNLENMASSIRQRAKADYQPLPKVVMLNYMFPLNTPDSPSPADDWCHDDWIGARINTATFSNTLTNEQRSYFSEKFDDLNTQIKTGALWADGSVNISNLFDKHPWCSDGDSTTPDPNADGPWDYSISVTSVDHPHSQAPFHPTACGAEHIADRAEPVVRKLLDPSELQPDADPDFRAALDDEVTNIEDGGAGMISVTLATSIKPLASGTVVSIENTSSYDGRYIVSASTANQLTLMWYIDFGSISPTETSGLAKIPGQGREVGCDPNIP
jgi:hypothetical protein